MTVTESQGFSSLILSLNELAARLESAIARLEGAGGGRVAGPNLDGGAPPKPMSEKQGKVLFAISNGQRDWKINDVCQQVFGKNERHLSSKEASDLIDGLKSGRIVPGRPSTAGAEAVISQFPGAQDIGNPNSYGPGDDGRPF